jgi:hypothetical protein
MHQPHIHQQAVRYQATHQQVSNTPASLEHKKLKSTSHTLQHSHLPTEPNIQQQTQHKRNICQHHKQLESPSRNTLQHSHLPTKPYIQQQPPHNETYVINADIQNHQAVTPCSTTICQQSLTYINKHTQRNIHHQHRQLKLPSRNTLQQSHLSTNLTYSSKHSTTQRSRTQTASSQDQIDKHPANIRQQKPILQHVGQ